MIVEVQQRAQSYKGKCVLQFSAARESNFMYLMSGIIHS